MTALAIAADYVDVVRTIAERLRLPPTAVYDRDDMAGEGYVGLMRAVATFDPARGAQLRTFIGSHVRWQILDGYRRQFPYAHDRYDSERDIVREMNGDALNKEPAPGGPSVDDRLALRQALAVLTPRERTIVVWYYWRGCSDTAIARRLGVDLSGVARSHRAALAKLRCAMEARGG